VKIVLNTSPIIFLSKIDSLKLLSGCIDEVYVSKGVIDELQEYQPPAFIKVRALSPVGSAYVQGALGRLHLGELEAILLAQELAADYVVLDDLLARRKAQRLGLNVIGTIGLLLLLEKKGLLDSEQTWQKIRQLTEQHGMYLSPLLLQQLKTQLLGIH
jgi:predicted nucleic acid-binding protein